MHTRLTRFFLFTALTSMLLALGCAGRYGAAPTTSDMHLMQDAMDQAMDTLDATTDAADLLLVTNAGYGQANGLASEAYIDLAVAATGCTPGQRRLVDVVTAQHESLWLALYKGDSGKAVFLRLTSRGVAAQTLDLTPERILTPTAWSEAKAGPMGPRTFTVVSMALSWSAGAPWPLFQAAQLHDHFCPGLNAGYMIDEYVRTALPLGKGDRYVFVGAPPFCAMDALQVLEGTTVGKKGTLAAMVPASKGSRFARHGVAPGVIALRVNAAEDVCDGLVLGLDWQTVRAACGVSGEDMNPPGGTANPMFHISRVTMSWKLAQMPMTEKMAAIVELHRFTGPAKLAKSVMAAKADPYAVVP